MHGRGERSAAGLGEADAAKLSGPREDILKEIAVNCAEVWEIEGARQAAGFQLSCAFGYEEVL